MLQWPRVKEWRDANELLTKWGYREPTTKVWNYFDEDIPFPAEVTGGTAASLAMAKRGSGVLAASGGEAVILVSDFDKGGDYTVRPDCAALGIAAGFRAFDLETGKPLAVENGTVRVKLPRLDYVMIEIK